jgi:hypothetical protein
MLSCSWPNEVLSFPRDPPALVRKFGGSFADRMLRRRQPPGDGLHPDPLSASAMTTSGTRRPQVLQVHSLTDNSGRRCPTAWTPAQHRLRRLRVHRWDYKSMTYARQEEWRRDVRINHRSNVVFPLLSLFIRTDAELIRWLSCLAGIGACFRLSIILKNVWPSGFSISRSSRTACTVFCSPGWFLMALWRQDVDSEIPFSRRLG